MAKGIEMNGQLRGKRGGVVYYRAEGQQISRSRNFAPRNPRTRAQMIQRLMLANASKAAVGFKEIIDHSFEGVQYGGPSIRHFQSKAQLALKAASPKAAGNFVVTPCVPVDAMGFPVAEFLISSGTLASASLNIVKNADNGNMTDVICTGRAAFTDLATIKVSELLMALGIDEGSQLTIVSTFPDDSVGGSASEYAFRDNALNPIIRLNFKAGVGEELAFDTNGFLREAVLNMEKSNNVKALLFELDADNLKFSTVDFSMNSCAVIVSKFENGIWRRSNEWLKIAATTAETINESAIEDWGWNQWSHILDSLLSTATGTEEYFLNKEDN